MRLASLIAAGRSAQASDLHLEPGLPASLRVLGQLNSIGEPIPGAELLAMARELIGEDRWPEFLERRSCDLSRTVAERVMQNLKAVLEAGGASFDKVVKTTIFVADMADYAKVNEAYGRYFSKSLPAGATVQVAALPRGARVAIDCLAAL